MEDDGIIDYTNGNRCGLPVSVDNPYHSDNPDQNFNGISDDLLFDDGTPVDPAFRYPNWPKDPKTSIDFDGGSDVDYYHYRGTLNQSISYPEGEEGAFLCDFDQDGLHNQEDPNPYTFDIPPELLPYVEAVERVMTEIEDFFDGS